MQKFKIKSNCYLNRDIQAYYNTDYVGFREPGNPDYINTLKNILNDCAQNKLKSAVQELTNVLLSDMKALSASSHSNSLIVCVVPRAKAESNYHADQLLFKSTVQKVVNRLDSLVDGTSYICRHTDTKTTHINKPLRGFCNEGRKPYPGITADTCTIISDRLNSADILLIDDIYTKTVNIDEDAIQALLDIGARSVVFYSVGLTKRDR
ncbi:MAG: amidophosphoribosyltransferase [Planctomycetes bacterium]|nr:amidophosphoribosyltransferase [Planctomycetota bacterium]